MNKEESPTPSFSDLGVHRDLCLVLQELGYEAPTPIQCRSIPELLSGHDLIAQAQTGTGKTAAFALPVLSHLDLGQAQVQALVLTPTRELSIQVSEAFRSYARRFSNFRVVPIYGGQAIGGQLRQLSRGPHVVVGTPGRVMDHLRRGTLSLSALRTIVLDEADEMLSMGFLEDIEWIFQQLPEERQGALFSATMPKPIRQIAQTYLRSAQEISIPGTATAERLIDQSFWVAAGLHKLDALTRILETSDHEGVLVFNRTKTGTLELAEKLEARGYSAGALNGDMTQDARERMVERFRSGALDILVATDVAARGLDVERISHVINYDIPFDPETYTHRIGRTGRAGRSGTAILFVSGRERGLLRLIERGTNQQLRRFEMPTYEDMLHKKAERLKSQIGEVIQTTDLTQLTALVDEIAREQQTSVSTVAAALGFMLGQLSPQGQKPLEAPPVEERTRDDRDWHRGRNDDRQPRRGYSDNRSDGGRGRFQDRAAGQGGRAGGRNGERPPYRAPREDRTSEAGGTEERKAGYAEKKAGYQGTKSGYAGKKTGYGDGKKAGFGEKKAGFGDGKKAGFGEKKAGFGDGKKAGFGEKKAGFGDGKKAGFGEKKAGFGDGKKAGFGEKKAGYGDGKKAGFGEKKAGFAGKKADFKDKKASYGRSKDEGGYRPSRRPSDDRPGSRSDARSSERPAAPSSKRPGKPDLKAKKLGKKGPRREG